MNVTRKGSSQAKNLIDGPTARSPLSTMNLNIKKNVQLDDQLVTSKISGQVGQRLTMGILLTEPERLDVENALGVAEDKFEEDSAVCTTEWDSDNEDAELEARLAKWFRCNDAKWADLICRIKSTELGTIMVPSSPKPAKVACEEVVEKYDDDFDVDCDLPCMKLSPSSGGSLDSPTTPELALPCVTVPVFEEPDEEDIEAWLAESEAGGSAAGLKDLLRVTHDTAE